MVAPTVASVSSGDSGSPTVTIPTGTTNGDLLIAVNASDWNTLALNDVPPAFKTGTGGITLGTSDYDGGSNAFHVALGARIANNEPANYTFPQDNADNVMAIIRVTGHDSTPVITQVAPSTTGTGTQAPSIVPNGSDDLLLCFFGAETSIGGTRTWTPPSGMTEHVDRQSSVWTSLLVASLQSPSNPSGVKTATPSAAVNNGAGCTISIKAAAVGGGTDLVIADMTVPVTEDVPTLVPRYNLAVADLSIASTMDAVTMVPIYNLSVADMSIPVAIEASNVNSNTSLVINDMVVPTNTEQLTLTSVINLAIQDMLAATRHDQVNYSQVHNIAIHNMFLRTATDIVNFAGESGGPVSISDVQAEKLPVLTGQTGSVPDLLKFYYGGLSGLAPATAFSISDHQRAYWETQTGLTGRSLADLEKAFYDAQLVPSGSLSDRAYVYWTGL